MYEGYFGVTVDHFRKTSISQESSNDFMQLWGALDATSEALWDHFVVTLASLWGHFGHIDVEWHV